MKQIYCIFLFWVLVSSAQAQQWQWAKQMGGSASGLNRSDSDEEILGLQVDKFGNTYMLFQSYTDLINPSKIQIDGKDLNRRYGLRDYVLVSFDCTGRYRWAKVIGGPSIDYGWGLQLDSLGGIYYR